MKPLLTIILCLIYSMAFGQLYSGKALYRDDHLCELKINEDSSVYFIVHDKDNVSYTEYSGKIRKVNDTLDRLTFMSCFQKFSFACNIDTLILTTHDKFTRISKVTVKYKDGFLMTSNFNELPVDSMKMTDVIWNSDTNKYSYSKRIYLDTSRVQYRRKIDPITGSSYRFATTTIGVDVGHKNPINGKGVIFNTKNDDNGMDFSDIECAEHYYLVSAGDEMKIKKDLFFATDDVHFTDVQQRAVYYYSLTRAKKNK